MGGRYLATTSTAGVVIFWDVTALHGPAAAAGPLTADNAQRLWEDLRSDDPVPAYRAIWRLKAAPAEAVAMFRRHLAQAVAPDPAYVDALVADLDGPDFARRGRAAKRLWEIDAGLPRLRALAVVGSLERKRRLGAIIRGLEQEQWSAPQWQRYHAAQALEYLGTAAAADVLRDLAGETPRRSRRSRPGPLCVA